MTKKKEKVVVTGGAGFIGSHVVDRLVQEGYEVVVIDDLSTGKKENIEHLLNDVHFIEGTILDPSVLDEALEGATYVLHQAARPSVPKSINDPIGTTEANINGTLNVLEAAKRNNVKRVVYASSSSVYGDSPVLPKVETMEYNPLSPYAVQKMTGELFGKQYHKHFNLETVGLRYFNVFGPRQDPNSEYAAVIPKFITKMSQGTAPIIYGDGETSRDFTYIDNVVDANMKAMLCDGVSGEVFNIAVGDQITLNDLVEAINDILGTTHKPIYEDFRPGDIKHSRADSTKAKKLLGWEPLVEFKDGLKKTIDFFTYKGVSK